MNKWRDVIFEDLFSIPLKNGLNKPSRVRGQGVPMVNMKEIFGYDKINDYTPMELVPVTEKEWNSLLCYDDLLFARQSLVESGAGKISIYKGSKHTVFESHLIRCRLNTKKADPTFVYYLFKSPIGKNTVSTIVTQTAAAGIKGSDLKELKFTIPPLPEQQAIAEVLSSLDDKIDLLHRNNKTLEALAETLFRQWFVEGAKEDWEVTNFGNLVTVKRGGSPRPIQDYLSSSGLRWLKISDVTSVESPYIFHVKEFINESGLKKTVYLNAGSLVVSNSATPGIPKILSVDTCIHDGWLYFPHSLLSNEFLYLFFLKIQSELVSLGNGSIFTNLKTDIVKSFPIVKPDEDTLHKFDELVKPLFKKMYNNSIQINNLVITRDTLLTKLMSGQVRVNP